jgi:hypothetical protein
VQREERTQVVADKTHRDPQLFEISVKNLYDDIMGDSDVAVYLPSKKQCSNKLPERDFFFGVLATLKNEYLKEII